MLCACKNQSDSISAVTREEGSGTRNSFCEILNIVSENDRDGITPDAEVTNSTAVMIHSVSGYKNAIGYISSGSMSKLVKAVKIDGVLPTAQNITDGKYPVTREFLLVTGGDLSDGAEDFMKFVFSSQGAQIIQKCGFVPTKSPSNSYSASLGRDRKYIVNISGSTSVAPIIDAMAEAYMDLNPGASVEIQQNGSSAGIHDVLENVSEIGMSSRSLTQSEIKSGITSSVVAFDGIAVIVNHSNPVSDLTSGQVRSIFNGNVKEWSCLEELN